MMSEDTHVIALDQNGKYLINLYRPNTSPEDMQRIHAAGLEIIQTLSDKMNISAMLLITEHPLQMFKLEESDTPPRTRQCEGKLKCAN